MRFGFFPSTEVKIGGHFLAGIQAPSAHMDFEISPLLKRNILQAQVLRIRQWERKQEAEWVLCKAADMHCKLDKLLKACSELVEEHEEQWKLPQIPILACQKEVCPSLAPHTNIEKPTCL